jgi:hypothetical protein
MSHATPEFFERNGFCTEPCEECNRMDQDDLASGMAPEEVINRAMNLALAAVEREQEEKGE